MQALLGDRYGQEMLTTEIKAKLFEDLVMFAEKSDLDVELLQTSFLKDENSKDTVYRLQVRITSLSKEEKILGTTHYFLNNNIV